MKRTMKHGKSRSKSTTAQIIGWYRNNVRESSKWHMNHKPYDIGQNKTKEGDSSCHI